MTQIGTISLNGIFHEDAQYTFLTASGIDADDVGKAVSMDSTANTVKLAADDDEILGRLEVFEDRVTEGITLGTVATQGGYKFPVKDSLIGDDVVAVGKHIIGAGSGEVQGTVSTSNWLAVEIDGDYVVAIKV